MLIDAVGGGASMTLVDQVESAKRDLTAGRLISARNFVELRAEEAPVSPFGSSLRCRKHVHSDGCDLW